MSGLSSTEIHHQSVVMWDGLEYNKKALSIDRISAMGIVTGPSRWLGVDMI